MKSLQKIYNEITEMLLSENVILNVTSPRPYLYRNSNEDEKLYFDEAYKYVNFNKSK